jgi:hypothetical protein
MEVSSWIVGRSSSVVGRSSSVVVLQRSPSSIVETASRIGHDRRTTTHD